MADPNPFDDLGEIGGAAPAPQADVPAPVAAAQPVPSPDAAAPPAATNDNKPNPFDDLGEIGPPPSSATGAFVRGAVKGALPAAGTLAAAASGAEVGGALGLPLAPFTAGWSVPIASFGLGLVGGFAGGAAVQGVQNWALKKVPDSWKDPVGLGDKQAQADEAQHGTASFLGGLSPGIVTMHPSGGWLKELPENYTRLQGLLAQPVTGRLFGGSIMGIAEARNEKSTEQNLDWPKIATATVFGTIFNRPNRLGEVISEAGAHPTRSILGLPHPSPAAAPPPTLAQAADLKVMGPGITEPVFHGTQEQAPEAAATAQENARVEQNALGEPPEPDLHAVARQMEPETFAKYDELLKRRETLAAWHGEGTGAEAAEKHLAATDAEINAMAPEIAAANRRAADTIGTGSVAAEPYPSLAHMLAAHEAGTGGIPREATPAETPPPAAMPVAASLEQRVRTLADERDRLETSAPLDRSAGQSRDRQDEEPLRRALHNTTLSASVNFPEQGEFDSHARDFDWAIANGREDIAEAIAQRAERLADRMQTEPAMPKTDEAYERIKAKLVDRKAKQQAYAKAFRDRLQQPGTSAILPRPQRTIGEQRAFIASDVERRLIAAGRPPEEARAAGQLFAARYVTRAGRFEGKLGTPEELYAREGAAIAGPSGRAAAPGGQALMPASRSSEGVAIGSDITLPTSGPSAQEPSFQTTERAPPEGVFSKRTIEPSQERGSNNIDMRVPSGRRVYHAINNVGDLEKLARDSKPDLDKLLHSAVDGIEGADVYGSRAKERDSFGSKLEYQGRQPNQVSDWLGGRIMVDSWQAMDQVIDRLRRDSDVRIVDDMMNEARPGGYRAVHLQIMGQNGLSAEVQVQAREMTLAGEEAHKIYSKWRRREIAPEELAQAEADQAASEKLYNDAWDTFRAHAGERPQPQTHAEPVNAALEAVDHIDALSPAEQKRELPAYSPATDATLAPKGPDQPAGVFMFDPTALNVDASRFQFKSGGDQYGVTGALRNVTKWDPAKAQSIIVWEANDGKLYVADGHQRAGLARRLTEQGSAKDIQLPGVLYRERDGISSEDIRAIAAVTNIANGSGSALDGAKVLRARPDLMDGSLPLSVGKGKQAAALARLGDEPFRMVVNDVVPEHYGAVVGELIPNDPARQAAAMKAIARFEPKNADEAAVLTQRVAQAELAKAEEGKQTSMFGDLETPESTAGEEMKIVGRAIAELKKDKALFSRVLANAERIEQTGSHIAREQAQGVASDAEIFAKTLTSDAYSAGPIRTELVAAAKDLKNGKTTAGEASGRILAALRREAEAHGADRAGAVEREPEADEPSLELAQTGEDLFEPGAEGKPQALIPGVKPVTQRDLVQAAANKPLRSQKAQKPMDAGLFGDSMDQKELFQGSPRVADHEGYPIDRGEIDHDLHDEWKTLAKEMAEDGEEMPASLPMRLALKKFDDLIAQNDKRLVIHPAEIDDLIGALERAKADLSAKFETEGTAATAKTLGGRVLTAAIDNEIVGLKRNRAELADYLSSEELHQTAQGGIKLNPNNAAGRDYLGVADVNPILRLMKRANASTVIHEGGHQFLAELMRDAAHPDAPEILKQDARTALDWLGVKSPEDIATRHHEKFARGFEQYLREGVAPSKELAGVFSQFRNWLLSIYQSIKGLGTEISPEIRHVFDRLLEMEPQRTIITPHERPVGGPLLHEIHAADAAHTEPHEAAAVFDRTKAEFDRYVAEPPPEIAREVAPALEKAEAEQAAAKAASGAGVEPGGEAAGSAGAASEVEPGGGGPQPQPEGGGVGQGSGQLGGGAGQPAAESDGVQRPDNRAKLGDNPGTALAPGPSDLFGATDSGLIDKAGNIVLNNLNSPEEVLQAFRESAGRNNNFIGDRRGVVTPGQVMDLARDIGMEGAEDIVNSWVVGRALNAEQVLAVRLLARESAASVHAAYAKAAASGAEADIIAQAQAEARHDMIQGVLSGATAEWGRAGASFRMLKEDAGGMTSAQIIQRATGKTLFQAMQRAKLGAELQTPQQVAKFMNDAKKNNFSRIILEYWINGLISGPATHLTYMAGNTISAIMKIPEAYASAGAGHLASILGREGTGVHVGEAGALVRGFGQGLAPALKAGIDAARTGVTTLLPGEGPNQTALPFQPGSELAQGAHLDEAATFHDAMAAAYGLVQGMKDTVISHAALIAAGGIKGESFLGVNHVPGRATGDIAYRGVTFLPTGALATLPGRGVAVIHSFYRAVIFSMEKNAMAYRQATNEGLTGTARDARVAQLRTDPSQATMNEAAAHEATEAALMGKGSELTQRLSALTNTPIFGSPLLKFIDPFVRVSGNIIDQSLIRRTPAGLLTLFGPETELARDLTGKNGNVAQDKAIGRMMVGTALAVTFGSLAAQKMLSGSGPKDPKEARVWMMAGNQPHSVRIGDTWYQVNKLGPVGMLASLSADLYDVAHEAEQGDLTAAGAHLLHAITQNVLDESAMHGPAELLKAIESPDRYGEAYIRNYLSAFVPWSTGLAQFARAHDPYQRDTQTMIDTIRNKIPGHLDSWFGNELPVRRDIWGEPLPSRTALLGAGVTSIYEQQINNDPVNQAMWKLGVFPGTVQRKIRNAELTPEQYDDFQRIAGRMSKMRLDQIVITPFFQHQTPSQQHDIMMEIIRGCRSTATEQMLHKYPVIAAEATQAKQLKKQAINQRDVE